MKGVLTIVVLFLVLFSFAESRRSGRKKNRRTKSNNVADSELRKISKSIHSMDLNTVSSIILNIQQETEMGDEADRSSKPLFKQVPSDALKGPTIKALVDLFDNYEANCEKTEQVTRIEETENDVFLDAILATSVMRQTHSFLVSKGLVDAKEKVFKEHLRTMWMGLYDRGGGVDSSCGLEHVFLGEIEGDVIQGFHSWIRFYLEEKKGNLNYLGYINHIKLGKGDMMGFPIRWRGLYKPITSMSLFNSPELDIALATLCFLARPNRGCTLQGSNGVNYKLQTYKKEQDGEFHLATAFFIT